MEILATLRSLLFWTVVVRFELSDCYVLYKNVLLYLLLIF